MKATRRSVMALVLAAGLAATGARAQELSTIYTGVNGGATLWTVYYDMTVATPLIITDFDINSSTAAGAAFTIEVYMTAAGGTYVGNTSTPGAWTLITSGGGTTAGTDLHSNANTTDFVIAPGTYGVAIRYYNCSPRYTDGTGANQNYSNSEMLLVLGASQATTTAPFTGGSVLTPRVWNGTVRYIPAGTVGACCKPDGTCISTTQSHCVNTLGGTYQGDEVACATVNCPQPPNGACCFPAGNCTEVSTFACTAQGGVWQGANTACVTANCPVLTGACCFSSGACFEYLSAACTAAGGTFQGAGVTCAVANCPQPPEITPSNCQTVITTGTLAAGEVDWYRITIPAIAAPMYLDIDTEGTTMVANDTEIGLFASTGVLEDTDDDDGSNLLSQLTYGNSASPRMPVLNGVAYNGRDGATLAAGTYYLAVAGYNSVFGGTQPFTVTSPSTNVGTYQVRVKLCDTPPATGACCKPDGTCVTTLTEYGCARLNGGVYGGDGVACGAVSCSQPTPISLTNCQTSTVTGTLAAGQINWYTITIPALATPAYLDIDTEGSGIADTEIALYRGTVATIGALEDQDDNDGSNNLSQLTYGNTSPRMPVGNGLAYNGRDGTTLAAGTWYIAVGAGPDTTFGTTLFNGYSISTVTGNYQLNVRMCDSVATGACCLPAGTCAVQTQYNCTLAATNGVYQGDGTVCGATACPESGACCKADGTCATMWSTACAATYGVFRGQGSTCATANCPVPNVFYSNCNISTGPTTLTGVAAPAGFLWSECAREESDPLSGNTAAGFTGNGTFRLADDFVVPAGGLNVGYIRAYAYLTGATTPGVTAATLQIWNGPPNAGGSVIFGDTTTNRLAVNAFTNIYRIFNTIVPPGLNLCTGAGSLQGTTRRLQYVYIAVNQFLPAGTYWIDLNYTGASFSPASTQADAIGRQCDPNNSNAMQSNAGVWAPLVDTGVGCVVTTVTQDVYFDVIGAPPPCYPNCDGSTTPPVLNVLDFACFLNRFAANDPYANCDNSTTPPVLNVLDFACFLNAFAAGCS